MNGQVQSMARPAAGDFRSTWMPSMQKKEDAIKEGPRWKRRKYTADWS